MATADLQAGAARRGASLIGLVVTAVACQSPASLRHHELARAFDRADPVLRRALDAHGAPKANGATDATDVLFAGAEPLDRSRLVTAVLERNPGLAVARQAWRAALARYPQATSLEDPMLGFGLAPLSIDSNRVDPGTRIDLSQRLPFPGKLRLRGDAALAEAEATGEDWETLRLELATLACRLFDEWVLAARALEINALHGALVDESLRMALARYAAGEEAKSAVLEAELAVSRSFYERVALESDAALVAQRINTLLHRPADLPIPNAPAEVALPEDPPDSAENLVARALAARPELGAADARSRAAQARVDLAAREFLPDFTLVGAYDRVWQEDALQPFVGIQINVPLALGRRRAALEQSQAELAGSEHQRTALEDDVRLSVASAALRLSQARAAEAIVRDRLLPVAGEQVETARTSHAAGRSTIAALIEALRELHELELAHHRARAEIAIRRAELDRALGRIPGITW